MHGASGCPDSNTIRSGDTWLKNELPRLISYVNAHAGVIFLFGVVCAAAEKETTNSRETLLKGFIALT